MIASEPVDPAERGVTALVGLALQLTGARSVVLSVEGRTVVAGERGTCPHDGGRQRCVERPLTGGGSFCRTGGTDGPGLDELLLAAEALARSTRAVAVHQERADRFQLLAEGGSDVLSRHLPDGRVLWSSSAVRDVLGLDPEQAEGDGVFDRLHPDDEALADEVLSQARAGGRPVMEIRLLHVDGSWRRVEVSLTPQLDAQGEVVELHACSRDVTERWETQRRSRETERRYRQLVDQAPDAIAVHVDGVIEFANPAAALLFGVRDATELIGLPLADFLDPELLPLLKERIDALLAGGRVPLLRQAVRRRDGSWLEVEIAGSRIELDGRVGVQNVVRPVADQEQARSMLEGAIRDLSEARIDREILRTLLDAAADAYIVSDPDGRPREWNVAAATLFGYSREQAMASGDLTRDLVMSEVQQRVWLPIRSRILAGDPTVVSRTLEIEMQRSDGSGVVVEGSWWPVVEADGVVRLHGLMRDIGPRRRQEAELKAARDAALAASSAKTAFLANMSHEIRTPLNGVLGMTALLTAHGLPPEQQRWAELAHRSGQGLLAVVNDVLDLAKIEAGALDVSLRTFDLRLLVSDAAAPLSAAAEAKGLALQLEVAPDLPRLVHGDPDRLRQVLINLLGNAVKFTATGSVLLSVHAGPGSAVWFAVTDTGPGIAAHDQDRLFEPFAQADSSTTRRYGGTGLGLSISRDLVQLLGGDLLLSSSPQDGSTFSFSLPMTELLDDAGDELTDRHRDDAPESAGRPERPVAPEPPVGPETGTQRSRGRLLLAEDSEVNQLVAVALLTGEGFEVDVVGDGQQALDRLAPGHGYDALLLDCQMPVLDGFDTVRELRRRESGQEGVRLPVLALTAAAFTEDRLACLEAGMDEYLSKPFVPADVVAVLDRLLTGAGTAVPRGAGTAVPHGAGTAVPHGAGTAVPRGAGTATP